MKHSVTKLQIIGFSVTALGGVLLHFLYDLTGNNILISVVSAVNESTWEHMKLLFFHMFIFALTEYSFLKERKNFWCIKLIGILAGLVLIPVLFYTYNGVFGKSPDFVNIAIFFVSAFAAYLLEWRLFKKNVPKKCSSALSFAILCIIAFAFILFTFVTPEIPLFKDPITSLYGIK